MKKAGLLALFVLVVALLVSCAEKGKEQLTGSWQRLNGSDTITFSQDGKVQLVSTMASVSAPYRLGKKGEIEVDLGVLGTPAIKVSLNKDELTLADPKGKEIKYLRIKEEATKAPPAEHGK